MQQFQVSAPGLLFSFTVAAESPEQARFRGALVLISMHETEAIDRLVVTPRPPLMTEYHIAGSAWFDKVERFLIEARPDLPLRRRDE